MKAAAQCVATQLHLINKIALAYGNTPPGRGHVVGVGCALQEGVETGVPYLAKVWRNGSQPDAQVVNVIARKVEAAPKRIAVGLAAVPYRHFVRCANLRRFVEVHLQGFVVVAVGEVLIALLYAVNHQFKQIEQNALAIGLERRIGDGGGRRDLLLCVTRYINVDFIMEDVNGVTS